MMTSKASLALATLSGLTLSTPSFFDPMQSYSVTEWGGNKPPRPLAKPQLSKAAKKAKRKAAQKSKRANRRK